VKSPLGSYQPPDAPGHHRPPGHQRRPGSLLPAAQRVQRSG
jgi:hypothetical protein